MIPQSFIQELLARVDIVDVIERYVPLKKAGANYAACCPFHSEKTPSFTVSPTKQFYHCFGCGAHGSAIGFLMENSGLSYPDAIYELAARVGLQVPEESGQRQHEPEKKAPLTDLMARAAKYYREQLKASPKAIAYLKGRGLTGEIAARFGLGYAPDGWQNLEEVFVDYAAPVLLEVGLVVENDGGHRYDRFRDRIMFPIINAKGSVIGFGGRVIAQEKAAADGAVAGPKYLNSPETPLFEKGHELYGLPQARAAIRASDTVIVVEGYMDVVALAQHGIENAVATLGTATTATHVQKLLRQAARVVFCFDGDNAGRKAARRALDASLDQVVDNGTLAFLFLPAEHDPDSYVREIGADRFRSVVSQAGSAMDFLIQELRTRPELTTAEGRSRLLHDAKPLIDRVQAPRLRAQLADSIARLAGLVPTSPREAEGMLGLSAMRRLEGRFQSGRPVPIAAARRGPSSIERNLLKIVLQKPEWSARLPLDVLDTPRPESTALRALADAVDHGEMPAGGLGMVVEHFRNTPHEPLFDEIVGELVTENFDESTMEAVFNDALERLRYAGIRQAIEALNAKERSAGLNAEERRKLAELLSQKQRVGGAN